MVRLFVWYAWYVWYVWYSDIASASSDITSSEGNAREGEGAGEDECEGEGEAEGEGEGAGSTNSPTNPEGFEAAASRRRRSPNAS
jgi:hypothetical protein